MIEYLQPPTIGMMNIIGSLSTPIDLEPCFHKITIDNIFQGAQFKQQCKGFIPPIKKNKKKPSNNTFYNQITFFIKFNDKYFKVKVFNSGKAHIPGCKSEDDAETLITMISNKFMEDLTEDDSEICDISQIIPIIYRDNMMITMQYRLDLKGKSIDREKLMFKICNEHNTFALYNPARYPGVKVHYTPEGYTKHLTIIIQASGIIAMKGGNSMEKNMLAHDFINKIVLEHVQELEKP